MTTTITAHLAGLVHAVGALSAIPVSRDDIASNVQSYPHIVVVEGISTAVSMSSGRHATRMTELVQVDLYQQRGAVAEVDGLHDLLWGALDEAPPGALDDGRRLLRLRPVSSTRQYDPKTGVVKQSITVRVTRVL
jgi:hypothetical protein